MGRVVYGTYLGREPDGVARFEVRAYNQAALVDQTYRVGSAVKLTITLPRSYKQLNFFFAWLGEVFDNLPEDYTDRSGIMFADSEHLRAWLLYRTGNCTIKSFPIPEEGFSAAHMKMVRALSSKDHLFFQMTNREVYVFEPKSIAMAVMERQSFTRFFKRAERLAEELIPGLDIKPLRDRAKEVMD